MEGFTRNRGFGNQALAGHRHIFTLYIFLNWVLHQILALEENFVHYNRPLGLVTKNCINKQINLVVNQKVSIANC